MEQTTCCNNQEKEKTLICEMMDWCFENDIEYTVELVEYAAEHRGDWYALLSHPRVYAKMNEYLQAHSER